MINNKIYLGVVGGILGILIIAQVNSFQTVDSSLLRDNVSNVFQEIKILKDNNESLAHEVENLELTLQQLNDQNLAIQTIEQEIEKYLTLSGDRSVFGPGVNLGIDAELTTPWVIDLINVFYTSGAQAVSVNGIRLTNKTTGFDTMPQGQILLNGVILSSPFVFNVIGESSTISGALEVPGGIFDRIEAAFSGVEIDIEKKDIIQLD